MRVENKNCYGDLQKNIRVKMFGRAFAANSEISIHSFRSTYDFVGVDDRLYSFVFFFSPFLVHFFLRFFFLVVFFVVVGVRRTYFRVCEHFVRIE